MTNGSERRADSTRRIPVEALVEVCGVGGKLTPFEAESADVSGRGIRLRTAYLPEPGAPVVCRFENGGREVIAEGVVAWCQKETRGGEFGVRFTALDARSAEVLRELCGIGEDGSEPPPSAEAAAAMDPNAVIKGAKVKLHIEGLGSPMRARIDEGKGSRIAVGSTLEFLKIGRRLEMESLDDGTRREARIDGLDVAIDPTTGVPRLLVLLKTDGDEVTPQPSVVDASRRQADRVRVKARIASETASVSHSNREQPTSAANATHASEGSEEGEAPSQEAIDEQVELMVGRMRKIAGSARRKVTEFTGSLGSRLGPSMTRAFNGVQRLSRRAEPAPARRKTAPPPSSSAGGERKLRPQSRSSEASQPEIKPEKLYLQPKVKRIAGAVTAVGLLATVIVVAAKSPEPQANSRDPQAAASSSITSAAALPVGAAEGASSPATASSSGALVAPVPLFGATPMATLEPAPLPAPGAETPEAVAAREQALAKSTQAAVAPGAGAVGASSEDPAAEELPESPATKPEDVAPWGKGRMKDPTLYRIKLDDPGDAIKGTTQPKGFTVLIPGRKAMESPKGFVSRDDRFAKISAQNTGEGVKITWTFKSEAPAYRVRLRKNNVEVLISEPVKAGKSDKAD
ncbi:MAG: PilZ domain-containing protein [Polyangiaceae bacterium]